MKKTIILSVIAVLFALSTNAQIFEVGDKVITPGFGLGSTLYTGVGYKTSIPPISVAFEKGFKEGYGPGIISIGGYLGITGSKWETTFLNTTYGYNYTSIILGARAYYHMEFIDIIDTYGGIMFGYNTVLAKSTGIWPAGISSTATASGLNYSLFVGGRYYFSDNLGVMAEIGYGISYITIGIAYKL